MSTSSFRPPATIGGKEGACLRGNCEERMSRAGESDLVIVRSEQVPEARADDGDSELAVPVASGLSVRWTSLTSQFRFVPQMLFYRN